MNLTSSTSFSTDSLFHDFFIKPSFFWRIILSLESLQIHPYEIGRLFSFKHPIKLLTKTSIILISSFQGSFIGLYSSDFRVSGPQFYPWPQGVPLPSRTRLLLLVLGLRFQKQFSFSHYSSRHPLSSLILHSSLSLGVSRPKQIRKYSLTSSTVDPLCPVSLLVPPGVGWDSPKTNLCKVTYLLNLK